VDEIYQALQNMKAGTAPGYDHVHPEFLKNLGPRAQTWLSHFFSRIIIANEIPTRNKSITSKAMQYRQDVGSLYQEGR